MTDSLTTFNLRQTLQTYKFLENQFKNSAGGYVFKITDLERLKRFLILGTQEGSYYASSKKLTKENATNIIEVLKGDDWKKAVDLIVQTSLSGAAPKQNPVVFAFALACSSERAETQAYAFEFLNDVCKTGTQLFLFVKYIKQFRGWGRSLRKAVASWYTDKELKTLCYQLVKYRNREGYTHADVLRLCHAKTSDEVRNAVFKWVTKGTGIFDSLPKDCELIWAYEFLKAEVDESIVVSMINNNKSVTWEMLPTEMLNRRSIWEALLGQGIPQTALIRQLPRLTNVGLLEPFSDTLKTVVSQLTNREILQKARVHPYNLLVAMNTYRSGHSLKGSSEWTPSQAVVDALEEAFYSSFDFVTPSNKNTLIALDISDSMSWATISDGINAREGSAAMAMVTAKTEPNYHFVGFTHGLINLPISSRMRLGEVVRTVSDLPFGATDCALPMIYAKERKLRVENFVIYTDSETYCGNIHPCQALEQYRQSSGINAKLCVVGMTETEFSIANPDDPNQMDVVGFDSAAPQLIADFSADRL
jgi:60 kDa SS-A/Ro ribonucleoprotein